MPLENRTDKPLATPDPSYQLPGSATPPEATAGHALRMDWPPPGLERVQGQAWPIIGGLGIGGALMVSPVLWATATDQPFWNVGTDGGSLWSTLAFLIVDVLVLIEAYTHLASVLRECAHAARMGFGWRLITLAAADHASDAGQLITASGSFADVRDSTRRAVLHGRIYGSISYLIGVAWLPIVFPATLVAASLRLISDSTLWIITLVPASMFLIAGFLLRLREQWHRRRHRRGGQSARDIERQRGLAALWHYSFIQRAGNFPAGNPEARWFNVARFATLIGPLLLLVPMLYVISATGTGLAIHDGLFMQYGGVKRKLAAVEALRPYRAPVDTTITPQQAAASLYSLMMSGQKAAGMLRLPAREYPAWPQVNGDSLRNISGRFAPLTPERREYIAQLVEHPGLAEFKTAGMARDADILGAALILPLPDSLTLNTLPIPKFQPVRQGASIQLAYAALLLDRSAPEQAELAIKQVIGVGLLMVDNSRTMLDVLVGAGLAEMGGNALAEFYRATGRPDAAQSISEAREAAHRASIIATAGNSEPTPDRVLEEAPRLVLQETLPPGLRWEMFTVFNSFAPCANLHNVLFGLGPDYESWLADARSSLVRYPADGELFAVARHGAFGTRSKSAPLCGTQGALFVLRDM